MKNPIVDLVAEEIGLFRQVLAEDRLREPNLRIFPVQCNLHPVPFFGDIRRADVLTMTLNPSWKEFTPDRCWPAELDASALTTRLLNYFDLPLPAPHPFFGYRQPMLSSINRSYRVSAAHVDLLSAPTLRPSRDGMATEQRQVFSALVELHAKRLQQVLNLACMTKVILVWDLTVGDGNNGSWSSWEKAIRHVPSFQQHASGNGQRLPILRAADPDALANLVADRRYEICEYLAPSPRLCHANYD